MRISHLRNASRFLALILAIFSLGGALDVLPAAPTTPDFDQANALYERGRFSEAAAAYEKMLQAGKVSPALYFNLGNALFKSGQIGRAIINYRHAAQLTPRDPDIRANLQFARNSVNAGAGAIPVWWRAVYQLTLNEWTILTSGALWLLLLLLALVQWRPGLKLSLRRLIVVAMMALVVFGTGLAVDWNARYRTAWAVVIAPEAVVRNGPLDESPSYFTVRDGVELELLDTKGDWLQVSDAAKRTGWLRRQNVIELSRGD